MPTSPEQIIDPSLLKAEDIFPYSKWVNKLETLKTSYRQAVPFPHIVLDQFLVADTLRHVLAEFPALDSGSWIHYVHVNERKYGRTDSKTFGPFTQAVVKELNSSQFIQFLTDLTGIQGLFADNSLEGGGLHQSGPGGYLNIHADFTVHPHHRDWRRRINILIYLNENWQDAYGGHLELWDPGMAHCIHKLAPLFNRAVIFNTDVDTFHGHPEPLRCPEGMSRKSIALYYFTQEQGPVLIRSTEYRARPGDGLESLWIYFDKVVLRIYDRIKRTFRFNDTFVSQTLSWLDRIRQRGKKNPQ